MTTTATTIILKIRRRRRITHEDIPYLCNSFKTPNNKTYSVLKINNFLNNISGIDSMFKMFFLPLPHGGILPSVFLLISCLSLITDKTPSKPISITTVDCREAQQVFQLLIWVLKEAEAGQALFYEATEK